MSGQWAFSNKWVPYNLKSLIADIERDVIYGPTPDSVWDPGGFQYVNYQQYVEYYFNPGMNYVVINN